MVVLIAADSRHGSTLEIAEVIASELRTRGIAVDVHAPERDIDIQDYEAVVLGSAVYTGHWMKRARELAAHSSELLAERPVWLFSSGPLGDPAMPVAGPAEVDEISRLTNARAHRVFAGKLDRHELGLVERAMVGAVHAKDGDFREWDEIRSWANEIADVLAPAQVGG